MIKSTLNEICVDACRQSLVDLRPKILAACDTEKDSIAFRYEDTIFPPTYRVDLLLLSIDVYCYKDSRDTGKYCDLKLAEWRRRRDSNKPLACEDCILGPWRAQQMTPIGYEQDRADDFIVSTSSCSATGYEYVKPTKYGYSVATDVVMPVFASASVTPAE
ncbi:hypothetical protein B0J13DRAFT_446815 [Dactylonectria estremocensis]|uniref:Uncharacterized protein n=1 Tax=Dactylonectria estremocensis TaxID=1079267 RepID=A0A9P9EIJ7_9HYPO|nr:hypothetical protein B0J13DRAFT_446815 [Dactylonectria estremocensis]